MNGDGKLEMGEVQRLYMIITSEIKSGKKVASIRYNGTSVASMDLSTSDARGLIALLEMYRNNSDKFNVSAEVQATFNSLEVLNDFLDGTGGGDSDGGGGSSGGSDGASSGV